jgi:hypothetical protein
MIRTLIATITIAVFALIATPAAASIVSDGCAPYKVIADMLSAGAAQEKRVASYRSPYGSVEIWVNAKTKTWSLLTVSKDGKRACFKAAGVGYTR